MKKLLVFLILVAGSLFPFACSDNNSNKGTGPTLPSGGASTSTSTPGPAPGGGSSGTPTFTPTFAVAPPAFLHNYTTSAAPGGMYYDGTNLYVAEGEIRDGGDVSMFEIYAVGAGVLSGGTYGNGYSTGIPTPQATPVWQGSAVTLRLPQGLVEGPAGWGLIDSPPGGSATLYQGSTYDINAGWSGVYGNYDNAGNSYGGSLFNSPKGLTADSFGNYYVADTGNGYVEEFGPPGAGISFGPTAWEHRWNGSSSSFPFIKPVAVACDGAGNVWVADAGYNPSVIEEYSSGGATFMGSWNTTSKCVASYIALNATQPGCSPCVYVSDTGNNEVEEYNATGSILRGWTALHSSYVYLTFVPGPLVYTGSNVIVADTDNDQLLTFGP